MNIYGSSNSNVSDVDNSDNNNSSRNDSHDYKLNFRGSFWNKKANNINTKIRMNSESEANNSIQNSFNSSNISNANANENDINNVHKEEQFSDDEEEEEEGSQEEESNEEEEEEHKEEEEVEEEDYNELNKNEEEYNNNEQIGFEEGDEEEEHNREDEEEESSIRETYEEKVPEQEMNKEEYNEIFMEDNEYIKEENINNYQFNEENDNDNNIIKNNSTLNDDIFSLLSTDNEIQINKISNKYGTKKTLGLLDIVYILCECKLFREIFSDKKITNINELKKEATKTKQNNSPTLKRKKLEFSFTEQLWIHLNPQNKDTINKHIFNAVMEILLSHTIYSQEEISEQLEQYLHSTHNNSKPINNIITFPLSDYNSLTNIWSVPTLVENFISINDNWIINIPNNMQIQHINKQQQEEMKRRNDIGFSFRNVYQCCNCKCGNSNMNMNNEIQNQKNVIKINEIKGEYIRQFTFGKKDFQDNDDDVQKEDDLIEVEFTEPISKQLIKFHIFRDTSPMFIVNDLSKKYLLDKHTKKSLTKLIKHAYNIYFNNDNHNDFNNGFYE